MQPFKAGVRGSSPRWSIDRKSSLKYQNSVKSENFLLYLLLKVHKNFLVQSDKFALKVTNSDIL